MRCHLYSLAAAICIYIYIISIYVIVAFLSSLYDLMAPMVLFEVLMNETLVILYFLTLTIY